jgi:hypothetical protein
MRCQFHDGRIWVPAKLEDAQADPEGKDHLKKKETTT